MDVVIAALLLNLAVGTHIYLSSAQAAEQKDSVYPNLELFANVLEKVRTEYVDGTNLTYHDLVSDALKGMIDSLDPHSEFMDPEEYQELQSDTEGEFGGLGLVVTMKDNYVTVVTPMDDTPGFHAGILSGDRIVKINGRSADKMSLPDAVKLLRGKPGTRGHRDDSAPLVRRDPGPYLDARHHQRGHGQGHQRQKGFPARAGQDRLHSHHAVWRQHQR